VRKGDATDLREEQDLKMDGRGVGAIEDDAEESLFA